MSSDPKSSGEQIQKNLVETFKEPIQGKITHVSLEEGWGFIQSPSIEFTRIFFHWTGLKGGEEFKELKKYMKVEFIAQRIPGRGWRAIKIKVVE